MSNLDNRDPNALLWAAISLGDLGLLYKALVAGAHTGPEQPGCSTPLIEAASKGLNDICRKLIEVGADVNAKCARQTALTCASGAHHRDVCLTLIAAGADVNIQDSEGVSPLINAASDGYIDVCKQLIAAGVDVNMCVPTPQMTPLHYAAQEGHEEICELLIAAGADLEAKNINDATALAHALKVPDSDVGPILLRANANVASIPTQLDQVKIWKDRMRDNAAAAFPVNAVPTAEKCFTDGKASKPVLDACVVDQFGPLVGERLIEAKQYTLFKEVWDALPEHWKEKNQGIYIEYAKREMEIGAPAIDPSDDRRMAL